MTFAAPSAPRVFFEAILYSYAQILFSNRLWFGAMLLAATFFHPVVGSLALTGVVITNSAAWILKFDRDRIRSGFYGFNGVLFGAVYGYFFQLTPFLLAVFPLFALITFFIAAVLEHHLATAFNLPGLSLPFMLSLYVTIVFFRNYDTALFRTLDAASGSALDFLPAAVNSYLHSLALVFVQTSPWAGGVIALALILFSRVAFVLSVAGFAAGMLFTDLLLPDRSALLNDLAGLNSVLAALALGGSLLIPSRKAFLLAMLAMLVTVVVTGFFAQLFAHAGIPVLVLPFNAVVLTAIYSLRFRAKTSGLVLLYFKPGSPEENYYYHHTRRARFDAFKACMADLPMLGRWHVSQGRDGVITHRGDWRYAWDFVVTDEHGCTYQDSGQRLEDYYCYRLPVTAPLDGQVETVIDSIPNNPVGETNLQRNWGNTIIIKHADGLYSALSHLEPRSARVATGAPVKRGEIVALCGSSGRSPEPHLHFQFQATGRLGDKTLDYPLGYYLESTGNGPRLCAAASPREQTTVQNLSEHRGLQEAFAFPLGSRREFATTDARGRSSRESWEVKTDVYNTLYIESSAGAWASFFVDDRMFYFTGFHGRRRSALFHFYLCATRVPLGYQSAMTWNDVLPLDKALRSPVRYLSELLLPAGRQFRAEAEFRFSGGADGSDRLIIKNTLTVSGRGLFAAFRRTRRGEVDVALSGSLDGFRCYRGDKLCFRAARLDFAEARGE